MTRRTEAAARALLDAVKPDRADHGRTMLVPRALVDALRLAVDAPDETQQEVPADADRVDSDMDDAVESGSCWECRTAGEIHQHHPVPRSRGGTRTIPLCLTCHGKAHHRDGAMSTSALVSAALQAKKARGEALGVAGGRNKLGANDAEREIVAVVNELRDAGLSIRAIAGELAARGYLTRKGKPIQFTQVARILRRETVDADNVDK